MDEHVVSSPGHAAVRYRLDYAGACMRFLIIPLTISLALPTLSGAQAANPRFGEWKLK